MRLETVNPLNHRADDLALANGRRQARLEDLERASQASERVPHLVGDDGSQLPELGEGFLLAERRLGCLPLRDVRTDGEVLPGLAGVVHERNDGRVHPVVRAVLGPILQLPTPDPAVPNRLPQLAHELLRMMPGVYDPVILAEQLTARVLRDLAELVVDVGDDAAMIGGRDNRSLVERVPHLLEAANRVIRGIQPDLYLHR